jgi:4a-hydroxytetrahydrobiopterin dehydratase
MSSSPHWTYTSESLRRTVTFGTYLEGVAFVQKVAELAEELEHHPDMAIKWREVELVLASHDVGGVTERDTELAKRIEGIVRVFS